MILCAKSTSHFRRRKNSRLFQLAAAARNLDLGNTQLIQKIPNYKMKSLTLTSSLGGRSHPLPEDIPYESRALISWQCMLQIHHHELHHLDGQDHQNHQLQPAYIEGQEVSRICQDHDDDYIVRLVEHFIGYRYFCVL